MKKTIDVVQIDVGPDIEHWYYRFWEFGTKFHETKYPNVMELWYGGSRTGATYRSAGHPARPFMRPAYETNKSSVERKISEGIYTIIMRETRR